MFYFLLYVFMDVDVGDIYFFILDCGQSICYFSFDILNGVIFFGWVVDVDSGVLRLMLCKVKVYD